MNKSSKLIFEISQKGKKAYTIPSLDSFENDQIDSLDEKFLTRTEIDLPEVSELDVMRHFVNLSTKNHHVEKGFYPLGSCTMKYNPKINEKLSSLDGFLNIHPYQPEDSVQGALEVYFELAEMLEEISGFEKVSLQPVAGAHGEWASLKLITAYHEARGGKRKKIIIPDTAHGTNPASIALAGYEIIELKSTIDGLVDIDDLKDKFDEDTAAFMITNPNTLGLFESKIKQIQEIVHSYDGLLYMDGANLNALVGIVKPAELGFDVMHFNLHKTFSTPHGGGGPGSGPIGVIKELVEYLPVPEVVKSDDGIYNLNYHKPNSIGKVHSFYGNYNIILRAYIYIKMLGSDGLKKVSENSIINANYIKESLKDHYSLPFKQSCMHEVVFSGKNFFENGVKTLDIAKRLLDFDIHAPTIYFPLLVSESLMIEPTETEGKETLDNFIDVMKQIAKEAKESPEKLKNAPQSTPVTRLNESLAAKQLNVKHNV